jgi:hypothetical protein
MADLYRQLKSPLKEKVSSQVRGYKKLSELLKQKFSCNLEAVEVLPEDDVDITLYKIYILIVKCSSHDKIREDEFNLIKDYLQLFHNYSEPHFPGLVLRLVPYFSNILEAGLKKSRISHLNSFYSSSAFISSFPNSSSAAISIKNQIISDLNKRITKEISTSNNRELIKLLILAQKTEICSEDLLNFCLNIIFDSISTTNDLFKIKKCLGQDFSPAFLEADELLYKLKELKINSNYYRFQFEELKLRVSQNLDHLPIEQPVKDPQNFDFDLKKGVMIYTNSNNGVSVSIYKVPFNNSLLAVKEYKTLNSLLDLKTCKKEIDIYKKLSELRKDSNCFIRFEAEKIKKDVCLFAYEYVERNLTNEMSLDRQGVRERIEFYVSTLIESFCIMEQLGIYHRDIKTDNILVTSDKKLKIIDFNVSSRKREPLELQTIENKIKGTLKYMAPEIKKALLLGSNKARYHKSKADVFSLGLVILEMCVDDVDVGSLNSSENQQNVKYYVDKVRNEWIRNLLNMMLILNYRNRPSFIECISYIKLLATNNL